MIGQLMALSSLLVWNPMSTALWKLMRSTASFKRHLKAFCYSLLPITIGAPN